MHLVLVLSVWKWLYSRGPTTVTETSGPPWSLLGHCGTVSRLAEMQAMTPEVLTVHLGEKEQEAFSGPSLVRLARCVLLGAQYRASRGLVSWPGAARDIRGRPCGVWGRAVGVERVYLPSRCRALALYSLWKRQRLLCTYGLFSSKKKLSKRFWHMD